MANSIKVDSKPDFLPVKTGKFADFNDVSGGGKAVDPYGDMDKCESNSGMMNASTAITKKFIDKVEADGTDAPCVGGRPGQFSDNKGNLFKQDDVAAMGNDAGKKQSGQSRH